MQSRWIYIGVFMTAALLSALVGLATRPDLPPVAALHLESPKDRGPVAASPIAVPSHDKAEGHSPTGALPAPAASQPRTERRVPAKPAELHVPTASETTSDDDTDLLPRGPNAWVTLDLSASKTRAVWLRQGSMARDGHVSAAKLRRGKLIKRMRGERFTVRVLHYGFDEEGEVCALHVQTRELPPVEGVIVLSDGGAEVKLSPTAHTP